LYCLGYWAQLNLGNPVSFHSDQVYAEWSSNEAIVRIERGRLDLFAVLAQIVNREQHFAFLKFKNWDPANWMSGFSPNEFIQISLMEDEKNVGDGVLLDKLDVFDTYDSILSKLFHL